MRKKLFIMLVFLCLSAQASAEPISMHAIVYPPLVYEMDGELRGVASEVVQNIQHMVGDTSPLVVTPWLRAYELARDSQHHALFAIVRIPERENVFKWVGPIYGEGDYFFQRKGSGLSVNTLDDARRVARIAVRKDGYTHQALKGEGFTNLDVGPTYDSSYRKLVKGRVDLVLMGERTYFYMVKQAGLNPDDFERTGCKFADSDAWLAFSRDVPDSTIEKWQEALDTLKANGKYAEILQRVFRH